MLNALPAWNATGMVTEVRLLKSGKTGEAFKVSIKVACPGITLELGSRDFKLADRVKIGDHITASGFFEDYGGRLKLEAAEFKVHGAQTAAGTKPPQATVDKVA